MAASLSGHYSANGLVTVDAGWGRGRTGTRWLGPHTAMCVDIIGDVARVR